MTKINKGFTLIELIVVLTILVILTTGVLTMSNRMQYANTKKAASKIDTMLSQLRLKTMSKKDKPYLYLYNVEGAIYYKISFSNNETVADLKKNSENKLSDSITLLYKTFTSDEKALNKDEKICINFDRSSGAFSTDFTYLLLRNGNDENKITLIKETGKHWID